MCLKVADVFLGCLTIYNTFMHTTVRRTLSCPDENSMRNYVPGAERTLARLQTQICMSSTTKVVQRTKSTLERKCLKANCYVTSSACASPQLLLLR
jgi:hypothetical protein